MNERKIQVFQVEAVLQEVSSLQRKAEVSKGQLHFQKDEAHQHQLTLEQQLKVIASLKAKLQSAAADFIAAIEALDEQKERSRSLLKQLKNQRDTVATFNSELKTRDKATKMGDYLNLYQQLMLTNDAAIDSVIKRFRKLKLLCHPDQGETQKTFAGLQQAHRFLSDPGARSVYELEGCQSADDVVSFKKN